MPTPIDYYKEVKSEELLPLKFMLDKHFIKMKSQYRFSELKNEDDEKLVHKLYHLAMEMYGFITGGTKFYLENSAPTYSTSGTLKSIENKINLKEAINKTSMYFYNNLGASTKHEGTELTLRASLIWHYSSESSGIESRCCESFIYCLALSGIEYDSNLFIF